MGRLSWTIMVAAKRSHTCLCEREAEGAVTTEEENVMRAESRVGVICSGDGGRGPRGAGGGRESFSPPASGGSTAPAGPLILAQ